MKNLFLATIIALVLTACGGNGGSRDTATMTTHTTTTTADQNLSQQQIDQIADQLEEHIAQEERYVQEQVDRLDEENYPFSAELFEILGNELEFNEVPKGQEGVVYNFLASQDASHYMIQNGETVKVSQDGSIMKNIEKVVLDHQMGEGAMVGIFQPEEYPFFFYIDRDGDTIFCLDDRENEVECGFYNHAPDAQMLKGMYVYIPESGIEKILEDIENDDMSLKMSKKMEFLRFK